MASPVRAFSSDLSSLEPSLGDALATVHGVCNSILPGAEQTSPLARVLELLCLTSEATRASLMVIDPDSGRLHIVAAVGLPATLIGHPVTPRPRSISEWVFRNRRGLVLNGAVREQRFEGNPAGGEIESALCLPLVGRSGIVGVLNLARRAPAPIFTDVDLQCFGAMAEPLAAAIERLERAGFAARILVQAESDAAGTGTLLPPGISAGCDYDFGLTQRAGLRSGGDLCERVPHDTGANSVLMVDVAGSGPMAAASAALVQGLFVATASPRRSSAGTVAQISAELHARSAQRGCITLWTARFDRGGEFVSCSAGYPSPFWVPADGGEIQRLISGGPPAGALAHYPFEEEQARMLPGDLIVAVSNGVLNTEDFAGNVFGERRVFELIEERRRDPIDRLGAALCDAALIFAGRPQPVDDFVVLAIRYAPGG